MRYEHLVGRALSAPDAIEQLCVAVATVGAARTETLEVLASFLQEGVRAAGLPGPPGEVTVVAISPASAVAVACIEPGAPEEADATDGVDGGVTSDGVGIEGGVDDGGAGGGQASDPAGSDENASAAHAADSTRLRAYLLSNSVGIEDTVTDLSYRVSGVDERGAESCDELDAWAAEWEQLAQEWSLEGEIWSRVGATVGADHLCDSPPIDATDACPRTGRHDQPTPERSAVSRGGGARVGVHDRAHGISRAA